eukprot:6450485-Amphidinium_carterae.1
MMPLRQMEETRMCAPWSIRKLNERGSVFENTNRAFLKVGSRHDESLCCAALHAGAVFSCSHCAHLLVGVSPFPRPFSCSAARAVKHSEGMEGSAYCTYQQLQQLLGVTGCQGSVQSASGSSICSLRMVST